MNKKLGISIVVVAIVSVSMFSGCIEEQRPTPTSPLETVSDSVKQVEMKIVYPPDDMNITFKDEYGRSFSKLDDGNTQIEMETFYCKKCMDKEIKDIGAGESFNNINLPRLNPGSVDVICREYLNVTLTLPNGKTTHTSIEYDYISMWYDCSDGLLYNLYYDKGVMDAKNETFYIRNRDEDGYVDGYVGARRRIPECEPTIQTIEIE